MIIHNASILTPSGYEFLDKARKSYHLDGIIFKPHNLNVEKIKSRTVDMLTITIVSHAISTFKGNEIHGIPSKITFKIPYGVKILDTNGKFVKPKEGLYVQPVPYDLPASGGYVNNYINPKHRTKQHSLEPSVRIYKPHLVDHVSETTNEAMFELNSIVIIHGVILK